MQRAIASIGGGGLIGGMAIAFKALRPSMTVIGVETHGADAMEQALGAGQIDELPAITSCRTCDRRIATHLGITVEPAASCTLAAATCDSEKSAPGASRSRRTSGARAAATVRGYGGPSTVLGVTDDRVA